MSVPEKGVAQFKAYAIGCDIGQTSCVRVAS